MDLIGLDTRNALKKANYQIAYYDRYYVTMRYLFFIKILNFILERFLFKKY